MSSKNNHPLKNIPNSTFKNPEMSSQKRSLGVSFQQQPMLIVDEEEDKENRQTIQKTSLQIFSHRALEFTPNLINNPTTLQKTFKEISNTTIKLTKLFEQIQRSDPTLSGKIKMKDLFPTSQDNDPVEIIWFKNKMNHYCGCVNQQVADIFGTYDKINQDKMKISDDMIIKLINTIQILLDRAYYLRFHFNGTGCIFFQEFWTVLIKPDFYDGSTEFMIRFFYKCFSEYVHTLKNVGMIETWVM